MTALGCGNSAIRKVYSGGMGRGGKARDQSRKQGTLDQAAAEKRDLRLGMSTPVDGTVDRPLLPEPLTPLISPEMTATFWPFAAICTVAAVSLGLAWFVGDQAVYAEVFPEKVRQPDWMLGFKAWWVAWTVTGFLVLPAAFMLLRRGKHIRDCNLSWSGFRDHFWIYVALFAAVFPVIYLVSWSPAFYTFYPMYPQAGRSWADLLQWEGLYAGQFIALEFFFRGFLVGGLGRYIGILSVPVSVMPYMMLHFSKPWPEAYAAIFAGFVLGGLAWKTKSIWGGVMIHCAVAVSMDLLALAHKGQLPWMPR